MSTSCSSCSSSFSSRLSTSNEVEHRLLVLELERQVRGDRVGQAAGVVDAGDRGQDLGRDLLVELDVLVELLRHGAAQRLDLAASVSVSGGDRRHFGDEVLAVVDDRVRGRALHAFDQHLHGAVGQLEHLQDASRRSRPRTCRRAVGSSLPAAFCATSMIWRPASIADFERLDRLRAADEQRNHHVREHDHVAQRQQRQRDLLGRQNGMTGHGGYLSFSSRCEARGAI